MGRFASTVAYCESARPPYPPAFFAEARRRLGPGGRERRLDVGTGPGLLAIGFAPYCGEIVGLDSEPAMLAAAQQAAARAGVAARWVEGRPEAFGESGFDLVTIGRARHWLDTVPALAAFERVTRPSGRLLVCGASTVRDARSPWLETFDAVRRRFAEGRERPPRRDILEGSAFMSADEIAAEARRRVKAETLGDRVLPMSTTSPDALGDAGPARALRCGRLIGRDGSRPRRWPIDGAPDVGSATRAAHDFAINLRIARL